MIIRSEAVHKRIEELIYGKRISYVKQIADYHYQNTFAEHFLTGMETVVKLCNVEQDLFFSLHHNRGSFIFVANTEEEVLHRLSGIKDKIRPPSKVLAKSVVIRFKKIQAEYQTTAGYAKQYSNSAFYKINDVLIPTIGSSADEFKHNLLKCFEWLQDGKTNYYEERIAKYYRQIKQMFDIDGFDDEVWQQSFNFLLTKEILEG